MKWPLLLLTLLSVTAHFSLLATKDPSKKCTFFREGFGKKHKYTELHGSKYCYVCHDCAGPEGAKGCTICPNCLSHHKGHMISTRTGVTKYFCDCGAGALEYQEFTCPHNPQSSQNTQLEKFENLNFQNLLEALHDLAPSLNKSFILSSIGLETVFNATKSIREQKSFLPIIQDNLKVESFYYGRSPSVEGIPTAGTIDELNQMIAERTGFQNVLQGNVEEAIVTTSVSVEKFVTPFDEHKTKNTIFYPNNNSTKNIPMMRDFSRTNYRYLFNDHFIAAQLPYLSGGSLVLIMAREKTNKNILEFKSAEITQAVDNLLDRPITKGKTLLFVPKAVVQTDPQSIKDVVLKHFPNNRDLVEQFDDLLQGAKFEIEEKGTKAESVTAEIAKGGLEDPEIDLFFDHPFIAIIMDQNNKPLFISYITF